ncbi:MAG TPA: PPOX class F420-dependent oxidoreductase [Pseudonocardiaceae bacterium]
MTEQLDQLTAARYLLLTTFRKDGTAVPTPIWFARDGETVVVWTPTTSGKVKRIRRDGAVTVAACDFRGTQRGDAFPAQARLLDAAETEHVRSLISKRYGLFAWLTVQGSRLRRGSKGTIGIAITLAE